MNSSDLEVFEVVTLDSIPELETAFFQLIGKQSSIVNRTATANTQLNNGKIKIKFKEPTWVYDFTIWLAEENSIKSEKLSNLTSVELHLSRGKITRANLKSHKNFIDVYPRDFIDEIVVTFAGINKSIFSSPVECKRIAIRGLAAEAFSSFVKNAEKFIEQSSAFDEAKIKIIEELKSKEILSQAKNEQLIELTDEITASVQQINALSEKHQLMTSNIQAAEAKLKVVTDATSTMEDRLSSAKEQNEILIKSITAAQAKRDELLNDTNIFMEEFSSYVKQGNDSINSYKWIGSLFFLIIAVCLWRLITSSLNLAADPIILKEISAIDLLLSRLPFAIVIGIVTAASMNVIFQLLKKVFEIQQERLNLTKLSILAKDNAFYSAEGLNIPGEAVYAQRASLKMELLKEFLSGKYQTVQQKENELRLRFSDFLTRRRVDPQIDDTETADVDNVVTMNKPS